MRFFFQSAQVVCLREEERRLRLRCEELELHAGEQEVVLREMEAAMQRLALDADRRFTQQHRDHQNNIQLLLQTLKEGGSGEAQQALEDRLQHLEKDLFFYKSSCRLLKKKIKELVSDSLHPDQPSHTQKHDVLMHASAKEPETHSDEAQRRTHIATTHSKMPAEHDSHTRKHAHQISCPSSSSDLQARKAATRPEHSQAHTQSLGGSDRRAGHSGGSLQMTPHRLCLRELRQISPADLQVCSSATRRRQCVVDTSTESMLEDSIEVPRNADG
ncbi:Kinesin-like protein KIF27 [Liparis tanakae]|uniref:Kinesin-like protein KIF27 n=1 Tax=Liparis tanakae TaxID=230148 RepID=A0A4Z2ITY9_9TELE|nr:Kinesin-like protein KIF27 [Liparis tanakae]